MVKSNSKKYGTILYVAIAILTARVLRQIGFRVEAPLDLCLIILRASIYIGLFIPNFKMGQNFFSLLYKIQYKAILKIPAVSHELPANYRDFSIKQVLI